MSSLQHVLHVLTGRRALDAAVWRACEPERKRLSALTFQLGDWSGPLSKRASSHGVVDTAIAAYLAGAARAGRRAGIASGLRTGGLLALAILLAGTCACLVIGLLR
ncbi:hypothetical protein [Cryptosporangium aurantiacum]|uniref:Uncharacterized protein n=1 Tax=Cryptosporangium aurantiacum TaxID=134849 RepID=A0A1M7RHY6_9ACTN|nr:hypothetical protein [Cryptosporangium aurantiacum]SHN45830.1 hypothetical protein SAMN05443668_11323 [Cryptosporangium aurantiacum]